MRILQFSFAVSVLIVSLCYVLSGPHRMRKKMHRNDKFYLHYPYDKKVAKQAREVSKCERNNLLYYFH